MSQHNLARTLPVLGRHRRPVWPWMLGIAAIGVFAVIFAVSGGDSDDIVLRPEPLNIDSLGMQEWSGMDELMRQTDDSSGSSPEIQGIEAESGDPFIVKGKIRRGQTLFAALRDRGLDAGDIQQIIAAMSQVVDFKKTRPGDKYEAKLDVDKRILQFTYGISPEDICIAERQGNNYAARHVDVHKKSERIAIHGKLSSSLYQAFIDKGEKGDLASHFMQLFKYDIDFGSDSQAGDEFSLIVDKVTLNGEFYRYGRVWAASYNSQARRKRLEAYYFDTQDEDYAGYYDASARALRRTFLKNPVVGCRMTSPFNLYRMHPILHRIRPHYGIDWACTTGTPIMAFADGTVTFADWKGGNGNLLVIQHDHGYVSLYAHLYAFAPGIKKGARVKQGQFVAKVGNTGISTGPHLHFAVKLNNKYIDPASIDANHAFTLSGSRLQAFNASRDSLRKVLEEKAEQGKADDSGAAFMPVQPALPIDAAVSAGVANGTDGQTATDQGNGYDAAEVQINGETLPKASNSSQTESL